MTTIESEVFYVGPTGFAHPEAVEPQQHRKGSMVLVESIRDVKEGAELLAIEPSAFSGMDLRVAFTSRQIVEGARSNPAAIARMDRPEANPFEISSRSDSRSSERSRAIGLVPPWSAMNLRSEEILSVQMLGNAFDGYTRLPHIPGRLPFVLREPRISRPPDR